MVHGEDNPLGDLEDHYQTECYLLKVTISGRHGITLVSCDRLADVIDLDIEDLLQ